MDIQLPKRTCIRKEKLIAIHQKHFKGNLDLIEDELKSIENFKKEIKRKLPAIDTEQCRLEIEKSELLIISVTTLCKNLVGNIDFLISKI